MILAENITLRICRRQFAHSPPSDCSSSSLISPDSLFESSDESLFGEPLDFLRCKSDFFFFSLLLDPLISESTVH